MIEQVDALSEAQTASGRARAVHFLGLDLVRFGAALLVAALHLGVWGWWPADPPGTIGSLFPGLPAFPELTGLFWTGWIGVQIFFVVSGFVIAGSARQSTALRFARSRFLRLYPTAWICASIGLLIVVAASGGLDLNLLLIFINTMILSPYPVWIDGVYWTLAVELVFYGAVFLLLLGGFQRFMGRFMVALGLTSALFIFASIAGVAPDGWATQLLLLRHGVYFALGMWLNRAVTDASRPPLLSLAFAALMVAASIAEILWAANAKLAALGLSAAVWPPVAIWLVAMMFLGAAVWRNDLSWRILGPIERPVRQLGLATYPLYLCHSLVGGGVLHLAAALGTGRWLALVCAFAVSLLVSLVIVRYLEPSLRRSVAGLIDRSALFRNS